MSSSPVNLRNLERIHEGAGVKSPRFATFFLAATGAAAVLIVGVAMRDRAPTQEPVETDPLAALVAEARAARPEGANELTQLEEEELDFPEILSDADHRTTALVAVKDGSGRLVEQGHNGPSAESVSPQTATSPSAADDLPDLEEVPVEPLPAGTLLAATSVTTEPKDRLSRAAVSAAQLPDDQPLAEPGSDGGYLVQVASFKNQDDAEQFVSELRGRGHRAFRQAANVPGRGIWHRVRIGSFSTKYQAELYKQKLEESERTIALVIDPHAVDRQQKIRAAKLAESIRKYGAR